MTSTESGAPAATSAGHDHDGEAEIAVAVERLPGSQASLRVEVPADSVDAAVDHAVRHLARRVRLPGFRPGKAPVPMVERAVGWPTVVRETLDEFVPAWYSAALSQGRVDAVGEPELTLGDLARGASFTFTATVTVTPEVDLGDYLAVRVDEPGTQVTDESVDEAVEEARRRHGELVEVDRPAQHGDVLRAKMVMRREGDDVGGGEDERDVELDRDKLLPGLADGIIGLSAGDVRTVTLTLSDDYPQEEMRGAEVRVEVSVSAVRERNLPDLDDALAVLDGHGPTLEDMRGWYRARLEERAAAQDAEHFEGVVLERLRDMAVVDIPEAMVDREVDRQLRDMELRLVQMGMRLERYLELSGESIEQVRASRREGAVQRVKLELVLSALAEAEGLEIDESDVEREEGRLARDSKLTPEQRRRLHMATHRDLLLRAAAQRALEIARGA